MKIDFQNTSISFKVTGTGPVIVWLHGFLETKEVWDEQCAFFEKTHTNVCIDLLGHGASGCAGETHTMTMQADAVIAVLQSLQMDTFAVVGHSMGGYVAMYLLQKPALKITHLVLLNSTSNEDTPERKVNRERALKIIAQQKDNFVSMGIQNLFTENTRVAYALEISGLISQAKQMSEQAIAAAIRGMKNRESSAEVLKKFKGKKLIIAGEKDPVIPLDNAEKESEDTGATLHVVTGGHMSYLEASAEVNSVLATFLSN